MSKFLRRVRQLKEQGARFVGLHVQENEPECKVRYFFEHDEEIFEVEVDSVSRAVPSVYSIFGLADFSESQASHTYNLKFVGNPNLAAQSPVVPVGKGDS